MKIKPLLSTPPGYSELYHCPLLVPRCNLSVRVFNLVTRTLYCNPQILEIKNCGHYRLQYEKRGQPGGTRQCRRPITSHPRSPPLAFPIWCGKGKQVTGGEPTLLTIERWTAPAGLHQLRSRRSLYGVAQSEKETPLLPGLLLSLPSVSREGSVLRPGLHLPVCPIEGRDSSVQF